MSNHFMSLLVFKIFEKAQKIKKYSKITMGATVSFLRSRERRQTKLSWLQNITSRRSLLLFEEMSSKEWSTVISFTIMIQKV